MANRINHEFALVTIVHNTNKYSFKITAFLKSLACRYIIVNKRHFSQLQSGDENANYFVQLYVNKTKQNKHKRPVKSYAT